MSDKLYGLFSLTPMERMNKARTRLLLEQPFFGPIAMRMEIKESNRVQKIGTDGKAILFNPESVSETAAPQVYGALFQSVLHAAYFHALRIGGRDPEQWNTACDLAVNPILKDARVEIPEGSPVDDKFKSMSAENIYEQLQQQQQPKPKSGKGNDGDEEGMGQNKGQNGDEEGEGDGDGEGDIPAGEVVHPQSQNGEGKASAGEMKQMQQDMTEAIMAAAEAAKHRGTVPADFEQFIKEATETQVDWRDKLRRFWVGDKPDDYSWRRPSRASVIYNTYLPVVKGIGVGNVVIAVDTSGSVSDAELSLFLSEINALIDETSPELVTLIECDADIRRIMELRGGEHLEKHSFKGRGGTDFRPPFHAVQKKMIPCDHMIYLTDLEGPYPDQKPDFPVLWVCTTKEKPRWGEVTYLKVGREY